MSDRVDLTSADAVGEFLTTHGVVVQYRDSETQTLGACLYVDVRVGGDATRRYRKFLPKGAVQGLRSAASVFAGLLAHLAHPDHLVSLRALGRALGPQAIRRLPTFDNVALL